MKFEIKNRWDAKLIFECDADSFRIAIELAVEKKIDLSSANLRSADLRSANLSSANLRSADLSSADLRYADLRSADLSSANLRSADLRSANLSSANLSSADLSYADLRSADLRSAKEDFLSVLSLAPQEVIGLYKSLMDGKVDGSTYSGECACLVGTIANVRGVKFDAMETLRPDSDRPAERWFLNIRKGHTPDNSPVSAITVDWLKEWASTNELKLPERKVSWE